MEFNDNKPIYLQIADSISEKISSGEYASQCRLLSVRELGAELGVNPNTVMRSYEKLTADGIIYNQRGIGYFVSADARAIVMDIMKKEFLETELPKIKRKMELLGISATELQSE